MDHHPDIDLRWRTLHLTLVTHSAGGVTELDLELARRIDAPPRLSRTVGTESPDRQGDFGTESPDSGATGRTSRRRRRSASASGSSVSPVCTGPGWITVLRGAVSQRKREPSASRPAAPAPGSAAQMSAAACSARPIAVGVGGRVQRPQPVDVEVHAGAEVVALAAVDEDAGVERLAPLDPGTTRSTAYSKVSLVIAGSTSLRRRRPEPGRPVLADRRTAAPTAAGLGRRDHPGSHESRAASRASSWSTYRARSAAAPSSSSHSSGTCASTSSSTARVTRGASSASAAGTCGSHSSSACADAS